LRPAAATNPYVGILAVFIGAGLATLNSRLLSIGLPDLRGALGLSFDDASWLPTALNMATMFSGVFDVFLNAFWGPRRILLPMAAVFFMVVSLVLPFAPGCQADRAQVGSPLHLTVSQAIDLALKQNRDLKLAQLAVTDKEYKKEIAHSDYFSPYQE
jgi:hypothetical protein